MLHQGGQKRSIALDTPDFKAIKCPQHSGCCLLAVGSVSHQLGDHGIVVQADLAAFANARIDPYTLRVIGWTKTQHAPGGRQESPVGIFSINSGLQCPPADADVLLGYRQLFSCGNPKHPLHKINSGNELGYRVLDLQSCIHL